MGRGQTKRRGYKMSVRSTSTASLKAVIESGQLGEMQKVVYATLHKYGPCTANELYVHLARRKRINQANIPTRLGELRAMKSVAEKGKRKCGVTGQTVLVWECTGLLPIKPPKRESYKSQVAALREKLADLEKNLRRVYADQENYPDLEDIIKELF